MAAFRSAAAPRFQSRSPLSRPANRCCRPIAVAHKIISQRLLSAGAVTRHWTISTKCDRKFSCPIAVVGEGLHLTRCIAVASKITRLCLFSAGAVACPCRGHLATTFAGDFGENALHPAEALREWRQDARSPLTTSATSAQSCVHCAGDRG